MQTFKVSTCFFGRLTCRSLAVSMLCVVLLGCQSVSRQASVDLPSNTTDFASRFYAGASFGQSRLEPQTRGTPFEVDSANDVGTQVRLGYDVHNMLAVEFDVASLGASSLSEAATDVEFSSSAISALVYGLNGVRMRSRREGVSAYARFGYGSLSKESVVEELEFRGTVPIVGLGAEYGFSNGLGIRAEVTRYDRDASFAGIGAIYRFGVPSQQSSVVNQPLEPVLAAVAPSEPAPVIQVETQTPVLTPERLLNLEQKKLMQHTLADRWRPTVRADDQDSDGVLDSEDGCSNTRPFVTVGSDGCGLFDEVLRAVTFTTGSHLLSTAAREQLDNVAQTLLAFPEARVQVKAHTDSKGLEERNLAHSIRRAQAVVRYLHSRGVNPLQLQALGVGELEPIASNESAQGRLQNRRVELITLPDRDALVKPEVVNTSNLGVKKEVPIVTVYSGNAKRVGHPRELWSGNKVPESKIASRANLSSSLLMTTPTKVTSRSRVPTKEKIKTTSQNIPSIKKALPVPGYAPGLTISGIVDGITFSSGVDTLDGASDAALKPLLKELLANPSVAIAIMAHTDDVGDEAQNVSLSIKRAEAVLNYLVASGIEQERMRAEGYGGLLPLVQNLTEADRARNRRVEIRVLASWPK